MIHCFPSVTARSLYPDQPCVVSEAFEVAPAVVERSRSDPCRMGEHLAGFILEHAFEDENCDGGRLRADALESVRLLVRTIT